MRFRREDDPAEYALSGHQELIGRAEPWLVDASMALRCFAEDTTIAARRAYVQYLRAVADAKWAQGSVWHLPWWKDAKMTIKSSMRNMRRLKC